jgi:hypothetical protein
MPTEQRISIVDHAVIIVSGVIAESLAFGPPL